MDESEDFSERSFRSLSDVCAKEDNDHTEYGGRGVISK